MALNMGFFSYFQKMASDRVPLRLYNTLTKSEDVFRLPPGVKKVRMYNCGPTVYAVSHIGNLRSYVFADLVRRVLEYNGFEVKQVINITDFGHLSSDADQGQDKMSTALTRAGMELTLENMRTLAEKYTAQFIADLKALNIDTEKITFPRASDHIAGEIALIKTLEEKGYAYREANGVYFDTSRFPDYGKLGHIDLKGLKEGARVAPVADKRNRTDFLLWKSDANIGWESPWGKGFPGWHIECSAMINATLGKQIDIHTGGVDLMPTHHNNEIAQSEAATGKRPLSRFWLHHEFLNLNKEKISKSIGNIVNLSILTERGFHPLAYRYFLLGAHYRSPLDFSWEALAAAQNALFKLYDFYAYAIADSGHDSASGYKRKFVERINDDLDTPGALAVLWEMTRDEHVSAVQKLTAVEEFDHVLGLNIRRHSDSYNLPPEVKKLNEERERARASYDWDHADRLRQQIEALGYAIKDTARGSVITRRPQNSPNDQVRR